MAQRAQQAAQNLIVDVVDGLNKSCKINPDVSYPQNLWITLWKKWGNQPQSAVYKAGH